MLFLVHYRILWWSGLLGHWDTHCWLIDSLAAQQDPQLLLCRATSSRLAPSLWWSMGLLLPRYRTLHLPLLDLIQFFSACLSNLLKSIWKVEVDIYIVILLSCQ